jgi:hypothetical protein
MSDPMIELNCWAIGQGAQNVLTVKILRGETVGTLENEIRNEKPEFQVIAADSLVPLLVGCFSTDVN